MRSAARIVTLALLVVVAGAAMTVAKVRTDHDETANIETYKTYMWTIGTPAPPLAEKRLHRLLDEKLAAMGYKLVEHDPDFLVATHARGEEQQVVNMSHQDNRYGYRWGGWGTTSVDVREIRVGTLVVDIVTGDTQHLVWRSIGTETISPDPEKNVKKFGKVLDKMFKKFPPKHVAPD